MTTKKHTSTKKVATTTAKRSTKKTVKKAAKKTTKKTARKTTPKVAKSRSTGKRADKELVSAADTECFWVHEGPILRDLLELEQALNDMSDIMFSHHVTAGRNDFADWVEHVLQDTDVAAELRKAKKPNTARKVVVRHLKLYKLPG